MSAPLPWARFADVTLDGARRVVWCGGRRSAALPPAQARLLAALIAASRKSDADERLPRSGIHGPYLPHAAALQALGSAKQQSLRTGMSLLRDVLRSIGAPARIRAIPGLGYRIEPA